MSSHIPNTPGSDQWERITTSKMLHWKHCLVIAILTALIVVCVFLVKYDNIIKSDIDENENLENDILYKYRHHLENSNARPIKYMSQRKDLLDSLCKKYEDPFRSTKTKVSH